MPIVEFFGISIDSPLFSWYNTAKPLTSRLRFRNDFQRAGQVEAGNVCGSAWGSEGWVNRMLVAAAVGFALRIGKTPFSVSGLRPNKVVPQELSCP